MKQDNNGNYHFFGKGHGKKQKHYVFTKSNYLAHARRHSELGSQEALENIEETLKNYDATTRHPYTKSLNYYKILKVFYPKYNTQLRVCKVYVFRRGRTNAYTIAGARYIFGFAYQIINDNEKILWKNQDSLIS